MIVHLWPFLTHLKITSWYLSISNSLVLKLYTISSRCWRTEHLQTTASHQPMPASTSTERWQEDPCSPSQTVSIPPEFPDKLSQATSYFSFPCAARVDYGPIRKSILLVHLRIMHKSLKVLGSNLVTSKQAPCWEIWKSCNTMTLTKPQLRAFPAPCENVHSKNEVAVCAHTSIYLNATHMKPSASNLSHPRLCRTSLCSFFFRCQGLAGQATWCDLSRALIMHLQDARCMNFFSKQIRWQKECIVIKGFAAKKKERQGHQAMPSLRGAYQGY